MTRRHVDQDEEPVEATPVDRTAQAKAAANVVRTRMAQVVWVVCVVAALFLAGGRAVHRAQGEPRQHPGEVLHRNRRQARLRCLLAH